MEEKITWVVTNPDTGDEHECEARTPGEAYHKACDAGFVPKVQDKYVSISRYLIVPKQA